MSLQTVLDVLPEWRTAYELALQNNKYDHGEVKLRYFSPDFARKYGSMLKNLRQNVCHAVVSAFADEVQIAGWSGDPIPADITEDLDRLAAFVHPAAFLHGDSFVTAWPDDSGVVRPTYQPAGTCVAIVDEMNPGVMRALVRIWVDRSGHGRAVYLDSEVMERFRTIRTVVTSRKQTVSMPTKSNEWANLPADPEDPTSWTIPHQFGCVPAVRWSNDQPDPTAPGRSILTDVAPLQDAINKTLSDILVTCERYSRPLWYVLKMGDNGSSPYANSPTLLPGQYGVPVVNEAPQERAARRFDPNEQQILAIDGEGPVGEFTPGDLSKLVGVKSDLIDSVAQVTGLPVYYFAMGGDVPSGESLKVVSRRQRATVESFERMNTAAWRGLAQLLGYNASPVWKTLDDPATAPATA